jgi:hypothetical protein
MKKQYIVAKILIIQETRIYGVLNLSFSYLQKAS